MQLTVSDNERKWRLLDQEIEDRAAMFEGLADIEKAAFFEAAVEEIMDLGRALGLDTSECRNKLEQEFQAGLQMSSRPVAGLCSDCFHTELVRSDRGMIFYRCQLAGIDSKFPKYPRLPVITCTGYKPSGDVHKPAAVASDLP